MSRRTWWLVALAGAALVALAACQPVKPPVDQPPPGSPHGSRTFAFTGGAQTFTVPAGVTSITVDALGAEGGGSESGAVGGRGGQASATVAVTPGEVLQIIVGGQPSPGNPATVASTAVVARARRSVRRSAASPEPEAVPPTYAEAAPHLRSGW